MQHPSNKYMAMLGMDTHESHDEEFHSFALGFSPDDF